MKTLLSLLVIAALAVGGFFLWKHRAARGDDDRVDTRPTTATVEARDISFAVTVAGEIAPAEQVSVRPEISGRIAALPVDLGDRVKKGQMLFTLDDKELQNQKDASLTEVERARLQLAQSQRNFSRTSQLHNEKLISQELFESTRTELMLASNALERAQKDLSLVEERLTKTIIAAPFDCTVLTRPLSAGQAVSGSSGFSGGTEVVTIADLNQMIINSHVNQADIIRLKVGLEVEAAVEAIPGLKVKAQVDRIAPQATIRNGIKGFATRMAIKAIDERIQPGMTANVTIPVASAAGVLAVPLSAVFTEQGERYVYVKGGQDFEKRTVQIGIADYFYAEVVDGLKAGETVALEQPASEIGKSQARNAFEKGVAGSGAMGGAPKLTVAGRESRSPGTTTNASQTSSNAASAAAPQRPGRNGT
jgi:HlyD family secretion protein